MTRILTLIGVAAILAAAGCGGDKKDGGSRSASATPTSTAAAATAGAPDASVCNYLFEWLDRVRFPLQADPHAAYTYVVPSVSPASDHIGFTVTGPAPYAPWTSWPWA